MDIYLLGINLGNYTAKELTDASIYETCLILEKNGISIDKNIIPKSAIEYNNIEIYALDDSLMTENVSYDGQTISIKGYDGDINDKNYDNVIKNILKKNNLYSKNIVAEKFSDCYRVSESFNGMMIFNNNLKILSENDTNLLKGTWYSYHSTDGYAKPDQKLIYATSALIAFMGNEISDNVTEITDIDKGYYAITGSHTSDAKSISAIPCYRITADNKKTYYYNILDGSFVE